MQTNSRNKKLPAPLLLTAILWIAGCQPQADRPPKTGLLSITVATQNTPYSGLIAVADDQGFFKRAGVDVTINLYPSGLDCLNALRRGEAEAATVADVAFAGAMHEDPSLRILAAIGASSGSEIVARKDRNIHAPSDLRGKRIGYSPGTSSGYFLLSYLLSQNISTQDITSVPVPPSKQVEAIVTGEVDAVSAFDVYAFAAKKALGENAAAWDIQSTLDYQWLLVVKDGPKLSREARKRMLKGLVAAEEFAMTYREETAAIISRKWNIDPEFLSYSSNRNRLLVSLNQSIVTALQSYVKWHGKEQGTAANLPDVLNYIDARDLEELDPSLVTVFK